MSVESWPEGQDSQRQRTIVAGGEANLEVSPAYFAEPGGPEPVAKASGAPPPDASMKHGKAGPAKKGPTTAKPAQPSVSPERE